MSADRNSWIRLLCMAALLVSTGVFVRARSGPEVVPPRQRLSLFPPLIAGWAGQDVPLSADVLQVLGGGEFLTRNYRSVQNPPLDLYIAYFPTQRTGSTIHSPQNCLPGAGWVPVDHSMLSLPWPNETSKLVNRYIIAKGLDRELVLYWYQSHGRVVASEYAAKFYLVTDSIRMNRSDGALVRVITGIENGESEQSAERRAVSFTESFLPQIDSYIPR